MAEQSRGKFWAFSRPAANFVTVGGTHCVDEGAKGMNIREYYAAHAPPMPQEWAAQFAFDVEDHVAAARWAAQYADALIKELES